MIVVARFIGRNGSRHTPYAVTLFSTNFRFMSYARLVIVVARFIGRHDSRHTPYAVTLFSTNFRFMSYARLEIVVARFIGRNGSRHTPYAVTLFYTNFKSMSYARLVIVVVRFIGRHGSRHTPYAVAILVDTLRMPSLRETQMPVRQNQEGNLPDVRGAAKVDDKESLQRTSATSQRIARTAWQLYREIASFLCLVLIIGTFNCQSPPDPALQHSEELLRSDMAPEASSLLEKIVEKDERNAKARALLGQAYDKLGRFQDAVFQLKKAKQLYIGMPEAEAPTRLKLASIYT